MIGLSRHVELGLICAVLAVAVPSPPQIVHEFSEGIPDGFRAWTNDGNLENGWRVVDGALVQTAFNEDTEEFGDRYQILESGRSLIHSDGISLELSVDILLADYYKGAGVWQGLGLFLNPENPVGPGRVFVILEKAENEDIAGLRIHSGNWQSELVPHDPGVLRWSRLRVRLSSDSTGRIRIGAGIEPVSEKGPFSMQIDTLLPGTVDTSQTGVALGCSAQYGYGRNPLVAFDNFVFSVGPQVGLTEPPTPASWFSDPLAVVEFLKKYSSPETALEKAVCFRQQSPDGEWMDRLLFAEMKLLRELKRWEEAREVANEIIERFPTSAIGRSMGGSNGRTEKEAAEALAYFYKDYHGGNYVEAVKKADAFLRNYPNNWRVPEVRVLLCYSLHYTRVEKDRFFEESNKLINGDVALSEVPNLLFLQAAQLVIAGEGDQARPLLDLIENEYPQADLGPQFDSQQLRLESYLFGTNPENLFKPSDIGTALDLLIDCLNPEVMETKPAYWNQKNLAFASLLVNYDLVGEEGKQRILERVDSQMALARSKVDSTLYEYIVEKVYSRMLDRRRYKALLEAELSIHFYGKDIQLLPIILKSLFMESVDFPEQTAARDFLENMLRRSVVPEQTACVLRTWLGATPPQSLQYEDAVSRVGAFAVSDPDNPDIQIALLDISAKSGGGGEELLAKTRKILDTLPDQDSRRASLQRFLHEMETKPSK